MSKPSPLKGKLSKWNNNLDAYSDIRSAVEWLLQNCICNEAMVKIAFEDVMKDDSK